MKTILYIGLGGFLGAISRYEISIFINKYNQSQFPCSTLAVNILGSILIGFIMSWSVNISPIPNNIKLFLTTGCMGGLTTFSTFSYETVVLFNEGNIILSILSIFSNLFFSILGVCVGMYICRLIS